jgi:hypothetical protein
MCAPSGIAPSLFTTSKDTPEYDLRTLGNWTGFFHESTGYQDVGGSGGVSSTVLDIHVILMNVDTERYVPVPVKDAHRTCRV